MKAIKIFIPREIMLHFNNLAKFRAEFLQTMNLKIMIKLK